MRTYLPKIKTQHDKVEQVQNNTVLKKQQINTNYPYTRQQINKKFNQTHIERQLAFNVHKSKLIIKEHLSSMADYGYDFKYIQWVFKQNSKYKEIIRRAYMRFQCSKCKQKGKRRRWTSYLGCVQIKFNIMKLRSFFERFPNFLQKKSIQDEIKGIKFDKIVKWELIFYREECKLCDNWGETFLFENQLEAIAMYFCWILANIMQNNPKYPRKKIDQAPNKHLIDHDVGRCEACSLGKCWYRKGTN